MPYREGDETAHIEGTVVTSTAKAVLLDMILNGEVWVPRSQIVTMDDADPHGNVSMEVTMWWAKKAGLY